MAAIGGICANCGQPMDASSAYCVHCGAKAPETQAGFQAGGGDPATVARAAPAHPAPVAYAPPPPPVEAAVAPVNSGAIRRGFFASLFDLSFTSLIATKIIKLLYVLSMIAIGLTALFVTLAAFRQSAGVGAVVLFVVAPLLALFYLIWTRVLLELFIALFRIMENTSELVAQGRQEGSG